MLRPWNINWQVYIVCDFRRLQSKHWRHNAMCRDELVADVLQNIGLKLQFSNWFSTYLLLHRLYRIYYQIKSINMRHYWIKCLASICILFRKFILQFFFLYSLRKTNRLNSTLKREFQSNVFADVRVMFLC